MFHEALSTKGSHLKRVLMLNIVFQSALMILSKHNIYMKKVTCSIKFWNKQINTNGYQFVGVFKKTETVKSNHEPGEPNHFFD